MDENFSTQRLLALRKLTRAVSDLLRAQMKDYLSSLGPLFRPRHVLGNYAGGSAYESSRTGEKAFKELQELYQTIAQSKTYRLPTDLKTPLEVISPLLEMTPVEYTHVATHGSESKTILITSPLKWVLTYNGFGPGRLNEVMKGERKSDLLQQFVLHYLMMNTVVSKQPGLSEIMEALHFPINIEQSEAYGSLPITYVASSISTIRPPDELLIESTEISGMSAFEEIVRLEDLDKLRDPLKERLLEITRDYVVEPA
jgi:hypothetical protein